MKVSNVAMKLPTRILINGVGPGTVWRVPQVNNVEKIDIKFARAFCGSQGYRRMQPQDTGAACGADVADFPGGRCPLSMRGDATPMSSGRLGGVSFAIEIVSSALLVRFVASGSLPAHAPPFRNVFLRAHPPAGPPSSTEPLPDRYNNSMTTPRRYLALDLETAKALEDMSDWHSHRPLGISCAASLAADADQPTLWHGGDRLTCQEAAALVHYLEDQVGQGVTLLTWNGLGFDLDILAEEAQMLQPCRSLALAHVDMMFDIFCRLGHGVGLDAAAKGMGITGKLEGMKGADAPVLWAEGRREEVLKYVAQDVRTTMELAQICESCGELRWVARSGRMRSMALGEGWLTVREALELPLPDTSWMSAALPAPARSIPRLRTPSHEADTSSGRSACAPTATGSP